MPPILAGAATRQPGWRGPRSWEKFLVALGAGTQDNTPEPGSS
jgi:hypothetical protein